MCIPLPTVVSVTFYSERRIRNAQIISRRLEIVVASLFHLHAYFFFRFLFSFFFFFPLCPSWTDHLLSKFIENFVSITRNAYFIFIDGCRFQSGTIRDFASFLLFPISLYTSICIPVTLKLSRAYCRNLTSRKAIPALLFTGWQIAFPSTHCNRTSGGSATKRRKPALRAPLVFREHPCPFRAQGGQHSCVDWFFEWCAARDKNIADEFGGWISG